MHTYWCAGGLGFCAGRTGETSDLHIGRMRKEHFCAEGRVEQAVLYDRGVQNKGFHAKGQGRGREEGRAEQRIQNENSTLEASAE